MPENYLSQMQALPRQSYLKSPNERVAETFGTLEDHQFKRGLLPRVAPTPVEPGNINLDNRPVVRLPDGSIATVRSMSANFDGREVLIPTVSDDGRLLSEDEAVDLYRRSGKHLGVFATTHDATVYGKTLSAEQGRQYGGQMRRELEAILSE